ncbi:MAG: Glu-tRNA(Gln) amidotransferase subunit GatD [Nanoarchaeota archaeon]
MKVKTGDYVKIKTKHSTHEGILIARPDILEEGIEVLKLESGYNIGIDKKNILSIEKLMAQKPKKETKKGIKFKKELPTVSILSFGGTISSKVDYKTGGTYADYTAEDFVEMLPELSEIANIKAKKIMGKMSEDFTPQDWKYMAGCIKEEIKSGVDGVVVTQGTDTMHFSASAMSFMLQNLPVPVIFTASQRSIDRGSSDAFMNLICSVKAAAGFDGAEVMTCMHGSSNDDYCLLIRGNKVRKMHTSRRDAFRPINKKPISKVYSNGIIEILNNNYKKRHKDAKLLCKPYFCDKTALVYVYPGFDPRIIDYYIKNDYKGIVIGATALGHVKSEGEKNVLPFIEKAINSGVVVVIASQTIYGSTHKYVYSNLRKLSISLECEFADDLLPETAYIKLGWALGKTKCPSKAKKLFRETIAGEFPEKSCYKTYLY